MMLDRRILYAALLVLSTVVGSSLLISYATQRGLGELRVDHLQIENSFGTNTSFIVYQQYYPTYDTPIPVVITLHGSQETPSSLYAYNIELARRNLTVVSIEINEMYEIVTTMNEEILNQTGYICSEVLDFVRSTYNVDDIIFGVLTHTEGFQIALRMLNFTGPPKTFITIGSFGEVDTQLLSNISGNFLMVIGEYADGTNMETAKTIMEDISGLPEIEVGTMYGNLEREDAFKLVSNSLDQDSEIIDSQLVMESCEWMIKGLQGIPHFERTRDVSEQVFKYQIYADWILVSSIMGIGVIVVLMIIDILRPRFAR